MAAITLNHVCKQFGSHIVLRDVCFDLHRGQIAGLIGDNGSGKTTLFKLMTGELQPDLGTLTRQKNLDIGILKQEPDISLDRTLGEEVADAFAELFELERKMHAVSEEMAAMHDHPKLDGLMETYHRLEARFIAAGGHTFETRINEVLGGLGFTNADREKRMSVMSGGQKCRAALAKLLLRDRSFLLLDEPTNHLDIDATRWLEQFLLSHKGGAVIISHDRYLLDRLCERIIELDRKTVCSFPGNYTRYAETRELRALTQQREFTKDGEFIRKERDFIAKHIAGQRTKEAQGRRTRLERRIADGEFVLEQPKTSRAAKINFEKTGERAGVVLRADDLTMAYGPHQLFSDLTFQVQGGQRLGITGPNGCGKTTLLKLALGEQDPTSGAIGFQQKLRTGYYGQEHVEFDPQRSVVDEIRDSGDALSEADARHLLARFLFTGDDVFKPLGKLSGGERSRVRLIQLIQSSPDVLILDEPTNHLDIRSREALEDALRSFPGTIIVVSHDRYFLDGVVDTLLVMRPERCRLFAGNYSFYVNQLEQLRTAAASESRTKAKRKPATAAKPSSASRFDHLSIDEIEALVVRHETALAELHVRFGDPNVYKNPALLEDLQEQTESIERELAAVDAAWRQRADAMQ